jgi:hypothetical protein
MAPKKAPADRSDPKKNKSLAIRNVIKKMPQASAAEVTEAVKREYGHAVKVNMVYMVKTKTNMAATTKRTKAPPSNGRPVGATQWVEAIRIARHLLKATGSVNNATALLKALDG